MLSEPLFVAKLEEIDFVLALTSYEEDRDEYIQLTNERAALIHEYEMQQRQQEYDSYLDGLQGTIISCEMALEGETCPKARVHFMALMNEAQYKLDQLDLGIDPRVDCSIL